MKNWRFLRNVKSKKTNLEANSRPSVVILILDQMLFWMFNSAVDSRKFNVVSKALNFPEVKSKESLLQELSLENQKFYFLMKLLQL